jgi:hypothetical protein
MSSPEAGAPDTTAITTRSRELHDELIRMLDSGHAADVPDEAVQALLTAGVRLYAAKRSADQQLGTFLDRSVTATDVSVVTMGMLDAVDLQLFELTLWSSWGRP